MIFGPLCTFDRKERTSELVWNLIIEVLHAVFWNRNTFHKLLAHPTLKSILINQVLRAFHSCFCQSAKLLLKSEIKFRNSQNKLYLPVRLLILIYCSAHVIWKSYLENPNIIITKITTPLAMTSTKFLFLKTKLKWS